jgi:hypothetical protein
VNRPLPAVATIALGLSLAAAAPQGWRANPETVAAESKRRPAFNYDESKVPPYTLPDVLGATRADIRTPGAWRARRAEILELFRDNVYGRSPGPPDSLLFAVTEDDPRAMNGAATLRRVSIRSRHGSRSHEFELILFVPNAPPTPVPVFLLINNRPATNTDPTRRETSGFWPAEQLIARGYGIAAIQYGQLAPDDQDRVRDGVMALFAAGPNEKPWTWGAIAAWGWGASRALDYLVTDARVDREHVAIVGHSRGGKAALWAGAEDARFAMVISNESGEGGAALSRRWFGETVERINASFPHWFAAAYKSFNARESALPTDQHMLLALAAPRPLYVASADEDLWSDPRGEFVALAESSPVYALWGEPPLGTDQMPAIDRPLIAGRRGYHIRTGAHNLTPYDWDRFADFADRVWGKK